MLINGENLPQQVIKILNAEKGLMDEVNKMNERFETARNLKNESEYVAIENEGAILENRFKKFMVKKIIVMTVYVGRNKNFCFN